MKYLILLNIVIMIFMACNNQRVDHKEESQASAADTLNEDKDSSFIEFEKAKSVVDKIKSELKNDLHKFYRITIEFSGEYDGGNKSWYFSPSFKLVYYEKYVAVEGGEEIFDFYSQDEKGMKAEYYKDLIFSDIEEKIWIYGKDKFFERKGNIDENKFTYSAYMTSVPMMPSYEESLTEMPVEFNKFNYDRGFRYSTSKTVEGEFGEVEIRNDVFVDSLLFVHLFGNKITEKAN